ncbi:hypothetical protein Glove_454g24 [Diversispora epigaea]|uniref:Uncharacterized protein n=1 Tax=Diversispora epigaea TaxID=1348612 RepID=A0A397GRQ5_9GLOM|nr:hypothetical protein Glove_454g24 [Diversispora epigaea]
MRHSIVHFENACVCVDTMGCGCSIESLHKLEIIAGENKNQYMELNLEFECLREITRAIIHKVIEKLTSDGSAINMNAMDFSSLQKTDEIYELLSQEVSRLQELYACQDLMMTCLN